MKKFEKDIIIEKLINEAIQTDKGSQLWKGIAIAGIWIGCAVTTWSIVYFAALTHVKDGIDLTGLFFIAFIVSCIIAMS